MEGYLAEIRWFAGNFAPRGWLFCQGQLLSIGQNSALFALIGTEYGGDGQTTFALPDFRGRVAVGTGDGLGLSEVILAVRAGSPSVTLLTTNLPGHTHQAELQASSSPGTSVSASAALPAVSNDAAYTPTATLSSMQGGGSTSVSGTNVSVSVVQPYLGINYIICVEGIFPTRN